MAVNFSKVRNPEMKEALNNAFDISTGHSHDGVDSKAVAGIGAAASTHATGTPVNAVAANKALTFAGAVLDGETVTIGADVYEFAADAAQSVGAGNIAVDITGDTTASQGTLTVDTQPTAGDTMTIGAKVYTFVPNGTANADGEVNIGTDLATAKTAIIAAINGTDGYNVAQSVSAAAFAVNNSVITALVGGVAGDLIATTETFMAVNNVFDAATLGTTTPGADCTDTNGAIALTAAITASTTEPVSAVRVNKVVTVTADVKGTVGNSIAIAEAMATASWAAGATLLSGGVNGTVGTQWQVLVDASYVYVCTAANTINDANWKRSAVSSY